MHLPQNGTVGFDPQPNNWRDSPKASTCLGAVRCFNLRCFERRDKKFNSSRAYQNCAIDATHLALLECGLFQETRNFRGVKDHWSLRDQIINLSSLTTRLRPRVPLCLGCSVNNFPFGQAVSGVQPAKDCVFVGIANHPKRGLGLSLFRLVVARAETNSRVRGPDFLGLSRVSATKIGWSRSLGHAFGDEFVGQAHGLRDLQLPRLLLRGAGERLPSHVRNKTPRQGSQRIEGSFAARARCKQAGTARSRRWRPVQSGEASESHDVGP